MNKEIGTIDEAINFLQEKDRLKVEEISCKWEVKSLDDKDDFYRFTDDYELIEWAEEQRQKIEEVEDE